MLLENYRDMTLNELCESNKIRIDDTYKELAIAGIERMRKNPDPHHGITHVECIFSELNNFLKYDKTIKISDINFNILLPAICWHDTWIGSHPQTRNLIKFIIFELNDGRGSYFLLRKYFKDNSLNFDQTSRNILYCVKKHARLTVLIPRYLEDWISPVKLLEAKILCDLDVLDSWSTTRINVIKENYISSKKKIDSRLIIVGKFWFFHMMLNANDTHLFFDYSKREFQKRKRIMMQTIYDIWNSLDKLLDVNDPSTIKYFKIDKSKLPEGVELKDYCN